jgi:hemerythrin-like domain-containing protein
MVADALCSYVDAEFDRHRKDQESGLFPALRARASAGDIDLLDALIKQLIAEHAVIAQSWTRLRANLSDIVLCRPVKLSADAVASFANLYQDHVNNENARLVSITARIIDLGDGMKTGGKLPVDWRASSAH